MPRSGAAAHRHRRRAERKLDRGRQGILQAEESIPDVGGCGGSGKEVLGDEELKQPDIDRFGKLAETGLKDF